MGASGSLKTSNDAVAVMIKSQEYLNYCYFQCPKLGFYDEEYDIYDYKDTNFLFSNSDDVNLKAHDIFWHILIAVLCFIGFISAICGFIIIFILSL